MVESFLRFDNGLPGCLTFPFSTVVLLSRQLDAWYIYSPAGQAVCSLEYLDVFLEFQNTGILFSGTAIRILLPRIYPEVSCFLKLLVCARTSRLVGNAKTCRE
ncbi:unnamed protein product [Symbiodinium sp. KB8]|nr:unnamed protein product [Symbiodinium sp. KB8]